MDDVTCRKVVAETIRLCRERGETVDGTLACMLVLALDLQSGYIQVNTAEDLTRIASAVARRSGLEGNPSLETLRLQIALAQEYLAQKSDLEDEQDVQIAKIGRLEDLIVGSPHTEQEASKEVLAKLYRQVIAYVTSRYHMGEAMEADPYAELEVRAALDSVAPQHALKRFLSMGADDRQENLENMARIVFGICLYNQAMGQGGAAVRDLNVYGFLREAGDLQGRVEQLVAKVDEQITMFADIALSTATRLKPHDEVMLGLRDLLINLWQHRKALDVLQADCQECIDKAGVIADESMAELEVLKGFISDSKAVPKEVVYPRFIALGQQHYDLIRERRMLAVHKRICAVFEEVQARYLPRTNMKTVTEERLLAHSQQVIIDVLVVVPEDREAAEKEAGTKRVPFKSPMPSLLLGLGGFCPVTLVKRNGVLEPIKAELGFVEYKGKHYGFATQQNLDEFAACPEPYLDEVSQVVTKVPELISLLTMEEKFPESTVMRAVDLMLEKIDCDFGIQTPVHIVEKNMDYQYEWNEWALRRRAIRLANIREKATHSMQTDMSHYRREIETQVYLPKAASTQTAIDKGQSMPQKVQYVQGLRGGQTRSSMSSTSSWTSASRTSSRARRRRAPSSGRDSRPFARGRGRGWPGITRPSRAWGVARHVRRGHVSDVSMYLISSSLPEPSPAPLRRDTGGTPPPRECR